MKKQSPVIENTVLIFKPDLIKRGLVGEMVEKFEQIGLKLMAAKMVSPDLEVIKGHYPGTKEWIIEMGEKTLASFEKAGMDVETEMGTKDAEKLGQFLFERLLKYWQEGPIIVSVWQGPHAVEIARKVRGHTIPLLSLAGTIHGEYLFDSSPHSSALDRVVKTFIHASGTVEEANREMKYWFGTTEFKNYRRDIDSLYLE